MKPHVEAVAVLVQRLPIMKTTQDTAEDDSRTRDVAVPDEKRSDKGNQKPEGYNTILHDSGNRARATDRRREEAALDIDISEGTNRSSSGFSAWLRDGPEAKA